MSENAAKRRKLNNSDQQAIYGVGSHDGGCTNTVPLNFSAPFEMVNLLNCKWKVACVRKFDDPKKFLISAEKISRYVFEDQHILTVYLRDNKTELFSKHFALDKLIDKQEFEINFMEEWSIPFDNVQLWVRLGITDIKYYHSNWATEDNFKNENRPHDVVLVVGDVKFYMLRSYLATWSHYFDRLFYGDFKEKNQKEIKLEEVDAEDFRQVLCFINPKLSNNLGEHNVLKVLKLADRLEIPNLMARCGEILCDFEKCKDLDVLDRLELADNHSLVSLQIACFEHIHKMDKNDRDEFFEKNRRRIQKLSNNVLKNLI